jgi:hypothetical protein
MSNTWLWAFLLVVIMPALAVGCALMVRRRVGPEVLARHNDVAGFIYAVIGVVYAVLLGFTAIIVWEQFQTAKEGVEMEANALADLYRDAQVFPPEVRDAVADRLEAYARLVMEEEWPAMAAGKSSPETWAAFNRLWRVYYEFKPQDEHQRAWYAESVSRMNFLGDQRRTRLLGVRSGIPGVMWIVLIGAGAVAIGFSFLFGTKSAWAQALMTAGLALTIGLVLLSILALEHPFAGITRIDSDPFEQALRILGG